MSEPELQSGLSQNEQGAQEMAEKIWTFDSETTQRYSRVRQDFISSLLNEIRPRLKLETAVDVGCGVGYFSRFLADHGFRVVAVDAREENIAEGSKRNPDIKFVAKDAEDPALGEIGTFDLVLCVGLLYHLENPFRAIRNLRRLTGNLLIVESMCTPGEEPEMILLDEGKEHDQGLNFVAFYPTESCLVKMLYRAGFPFVYRFRQLPDDEQFVSTARRKRSRTFLAASSVELGAHNLELAPELARWAVGGNDLWTTRYSRWLHFLSTKVISTKSLLRRLIRSSSTAAVSPPSDSDTALKQGR